MKSQRVACRANVETGKEGEEKGGGLERKEKGRLFFSLFPFSFIALPLPFLHLRRRLSNVIQHCRVISSVDHFTQVIASYIVQSKSTADVQLSQV